MNVRKITWAEKVQSSAVFAVCSDWTGIYISSLIGWHARLCFLLRCSYKKSETCVNLIELKCVSRQGFMQQLRQQQQNIISHSTFKDKAEILIQPCARYCLYFTLSPEFSEQCW